MAGPDTRNPDAVAGAMYFIVGRGSEGGPDPYRMTVTGVNAKTWGDPSAVILNSGYSIGTIQVDLGRRGTWGLGKTTGPAAPGEVSYVDGLIDEAGRHARENHLPFAEDTAKLRSDLLTHGNGQKGRSTISFIDEGTRDSINAWAASSQGKQWIHSNVDFPQVKAASDTALEIVDRYGTHIADDDRLASIALLAKTANQTPSYLPRLRETLKAGGDYHALVDTAREIAADNHVYHGLKAIELADRYKAAYENPERAAAIERAEEKVAKRGFDPSSQGSDTDVQEALQAIGQGANRGQASPSNTLRLGSRGDRVVELQGQLATLGITDSSGHPIRADGHFGPATHAAVARFQQGHGLSADGVVGPRTLQAMNTELDHGRQTNRMSLADPAHPGVSMYEQALEGVRMIDEKFGRQTDQASCNLAGSLAVGACAAGFTRVDHVVMSDDGSRAYAVQGQLNSPFKQYTDVDVAKAVAVPLEQSGAQFLQASQQREQQAVAAQQVQAQTQEQQAAPQQPVMSR